MPDIGVPELVIILVVLLVLFGGSQLPKLARNLGQAQQEFKKGLSDASKDPEPGSTESAAAPSAAAPPIAPDAATAATLPPPPPAPQP